MHKRRILSDYQRPKLSQVPTNAFSAFPPSLTVEQAYYNCTGRTVIVSLRNGLRLRLEPENHDGKNGFTIKTTFRVSDRIAESLENYLANMDCDQDSPLFPFKEGMLTRPYKTGNYRLIIVDHFLERRLLGQDSTTIYVTDADVLLTMTDHAESAPFHPYSENGLRDSQGKDVAQSAFAIKLDLVDNSNTIGPHFINVNGEVYFVPPIVDPLRKDGLYRYSRKPYDPDSIDRQTYEDYFSLDNLLSAGLHRTIEAAKYHGDTALKQKEEILKASHDAELLKIQSIVSRTESDKAKYDAEIQKLEQTKELLSIEREELKAELLAERQRMEMKDYYERISYQRKDQSEFMKHLPTLIIGLGAVAAAIFSFG